MDYRSMAQNDIKPDALIAPLEELARAAGAVILEVYASDFSIYQKDDQSPVTEADRRAEAIILPGLHRLTPDIPIIAEEEVAAGRIPEITANAFWLVDPLDGTKEFIKRNGEFTVNIGLIVDGKPAVGVVLAPAQSVMWSGAGVGTATKIDADGRRISISCRAVPTTEPVVVTSRSHGNAEEMAHWLAPLQSPITQYAGSSLKFCQVAEGLADYYPRFGPTCEWDVAAAHAVLQAAGGEIVTFDEKPLAYRKPKFLNPNFLARAKVQSS